MTARKGLRIVTGPDPVTQWQVLVDGVDVTNIIRVISADVRIRAGEMTEVHLRCYADGVEVLDPLWSTRIEPWPPKRTLRERLSGTWHRLAERWGEWW